MTFPFAPLLLFSSCLHLKLFSAYIPVCFFWQDISRHRTRLAPRASDRGARPPMEPTIDIERHNRITRLAPRASLSRTPSLVSALAVKTAVHASLAPDNGLPLPIIDDRLRPRGPLLGIAHPQGQARGRPVVPIYRAPTSVFRSVPGQSRATRTHALPPTII